MTFLKVAREIIANTNATMGESFLGRALVALRAHRADVAAQIKAQAS